MEIREKFWWTVVNPAIVRGVNTEGVWAFKSTFSKFLYNFFKISFISNIFLVSLKLKKISDFLQNFSKFMWPLLKFFNLLHVFCKYPSKLLRKLRILLWNFSDVSLQLIRISGKLWQKIIIRSFSKFISLSKIL